MPDASPKDSANVSVAGDDDMDELATLMQGMAVKNVCVTCQQPYVFLYLSIYDHLTFSSSLKPEEENHCRACRKAFVSVVQKAMSEDGTIYRSAKIRKILELLAHIKQNERGVQKTIIFSQFVKMIDLISLVLKEMGIAHVRCEVQPAGWNC